MKTTVISVLAVWAAFTVNAVESSLTSGVRLQAEGKPIDEEIGHLVPTVVDWNGDGKLDLLVGNFYSDRRPTGGNIWLFLGQ